METDRRAIQVTDPEHVFFEIRNEPHDIKPEVWRAQAEEIIKAIRSVDTKHTLIVGFHDWNSRQALSNQSLSMTRTLSTRFIITTHSFSRIRVRHGR